MVILVLGALALAADPSQPHPHQGVLGRYEGAPPRPTLSDEDLAALLRGEPVLKQEKHGAGSGVGVGVQDIHASAATIWAQVLNYANYPNVVQNVKTCEVYEQKGDRVKVHFIIGVPLVNIEYWVDHVVNKSEGWLSWTLDYSKNSDFDDSIGFWRIDEQADRPGFTRVFYSAAVKSKGWVPAPIEDGFTKMGLRKATEWVKREAEKAQGTAK